MKKVVLFLLALTAAFNTFATCTANFTAAMAPVNNFLLRLSLNNTSSYSTLPAGSYVQYQVWWGDGGNSYIWTGTSTHDYAATGTYTVGLKISVIDSFTSTVTCTDSIAKTVTVAYSPCASSFSIAKSGLTVTVTAANPAGTSGMTYSWNWGDGSPAGSGSPATHTYTTGGSKTITLSATGGSCTYTNTATTAVTGTNCTGLNASFSHFVSGMTLNVSNTSTVSAGKTRNSTWYFGDGGTSTIFNTSHTYASSGTYTVSLVNQWKDSASGAVYCTDTATKTITITPGSNVISGYIIEDSTLAVSSPQYTVWLIVFDSTTNMLTAIDSLTFTGTPLISSYQFTGKPAGTYRVKAKLLNGPTSGTGALPTYHNSSLMWNTATTFYHAGGTTTGKNIVLIYGTVTGGPGFIGGNVSAGANKGTASPIPGMNILLLNGAGNAVACATTDANGDYSFGNLPPASYSVYPEEVGYNTTPVGVTVLNAEPSYPNVNFSRSVSKKTITPNTNGITNVNAAADFVIYPNPAKDRVTISWNNQYKSDVTVIVTDVTGKKVHQATVTSSGKTEVNMSDLQKGLYFITVEANNVKTTQKLILQ